MSMMRSADVSIRGTIKCGDTCQTWKFDEEVQDSAFGEQRIPNRVADGESQNAHTHLCMSTLTGVIELEIFNHSGYLMECENSSFYGKEIASFTTKKLHECRTQEFGLGIVHAVEILHLGMENSSCMPISVKESNNDPMFNSIWREARKTPNDGVEEYMSLPEYRVALHSNWLSRICG
ncbi:hypothetical protein K438DRAFT_1754088 [Mycena galopus ATCC 62051]|nr:hypothetical protein K438DRAFT_1754088 [Mycena galopus ATCC 62051]